MSYTSIKSVGLTLKPLLTISGHKGIVNGIVYLPGGGGLVTCSYDKTVRIWNMESGEQEGMAMELGGWAEGLVATKDGKRILSGSRDKVSKVWDVETHQPIAEWGGHEASICCIAISPDDQLVASGDNKGKIIIRETNLKEDGRIKQAIETGHSVYSICFSPDGTKVASGHADNMIRVFDVDNGDLILGPIEGHTNWVYSVVWSLDGSRLVTASFDGSIRFWDTATGKAISDPLTGHTGCVNSISLSPDGAKLASASGDKTVRFWGTDSGDPIGEPLQHENPVWAVTFSPSSEFVACGESSGKVSIWHVPRWDDSKNAHKSLLDPPAVTTPRHTELSIMVESASRTNSHNVNQPSPASPDKAEDVQVSCCALLSRRRARSGTASVLPAIELSEHAAPTSNPPVPRGVTPSHPTAQNVVDLPAVVEPLSHTR
ncbi:WD40 repeat-like protein [Paxillus ammoniavirescens]|nr:WD40 repeat-like protein [Paxillus ammoniavirescens]